LLRSFETLHGVIVGTPPYISPEQARGDLEQIDSRSDIYVLGGILYAILALRAPVDGATVPEMVQNILGSKITPPLSFNPTPRLLRPPADLPLEELVTLHHCPGKRVPEGLSAVVMKAMQLAPEKRYPCVEDLQADVIAWQGGFATKAERAGFGKHIWLWVMRHRMSVSISAVGFLLFNVMLIAFVYQLAGERNRAIANAQRALISEQHAKASEQLAAERLNELRSTAPTFYNEAAALLQQQDFARALDRIDYALEQVPNEAGYHALRGNVLQSLLRWEEAIGAYEEALERNPRMVNARLNLDLTTRLLSSVTQEGRLRATTLRELHHSLLQQKRSGEAAGLMKQIQRKPFDASLVVAPPQPSYEEPAAEEEVIPGSAERKIRIQ
jgi:tetratricopeptide (TPR) repeat protein